ncbi:MAG: undecaprenyl-diphosphatase UppP [Planctomycetes bacterium]|nr:undecaprenyl-diphosphatase UppP [Planctomycetota bacterium]
MDFIQAVLLGIIQGFTEFLPISSTAHLRVVPALLGWERDPGAAFTAVIQWGTLLAALIYFRSDILRITIAVLDGLRTRDPWGHPDARMGWMIALGTVPIVVCGLAFKKAIKEDLRSLYVIAAAAIGLAIVLLSAELWVRRRQQKGQPLKGMSDLGWWDAVATGLAQAVALIPGASRSGVTITGGLFLGMDRATAARFSFLMSLPSVFAAGVYELYDERHTLLASQADALNLATATVVSGLVGYATIAFLLSFLKSHTTLVFILYRVLLGGLLLALLWQGVLQPGTGLAE